LSERCGTDATQRRQVAQPDGGVAGGARQPHRLRDDYTLKEFNGDRIPQRRSTRHLLDRRGGSLGPA
jgi:hypothetical protein